MKAFLRFGTIESLLTLTLALGVDLYLLPYFRTDKGAEAVYVRLLVGAVFGAGAIALTLVRLLMNWRQSR